MGEIGECVVCFLCVRLLLLGQALRQRAVLGMSRWSGHGGEAWYEGDAMCLGWLCACWGEEECEWVVKTSLHLHFCLLCRDKYSSMKGKVEVKSSYLVGRDLMYEISSRQHFVPVQVRLPHHYIARRQIVQSYPKTKASYSQTSSLLWVFSLSNSMPIARRVSFAYPCPQWTAVPLSPSGKSYCNFRPIACHFGPFFSHFACFAAHLCLEALTSCNVCVPGQSLCQWQA